VEDREGVQEGCGRAWRGPEGPEEVVDAGEECGRDGKAWEGNATLLHGGNTLYLVIHIS